MAEGARALPHVGAGMRARSIIPLGPMIAPFLEEAARQGFSLVDTLVREWESGANRFNRRGECFLGVFRGGDLVGVGGLNRDPYADLGHVGRIRHVYVLDRCRRSGVGRFLMRELLGRATAAFELVRLRTHTPEGAAFYASLGFRGINSEDATHSLAMATGVQPVTKGD